MAEDVILTAIDVRGIATVTLNRPAACNAYDDAMLSTLTKALTRLAGEQAVRLVLLRGAGEHFQSGADPQFLGLLKDKPIENGIQFARLMLTTIDALRRLPQPTIALVHGNCLGGGIGFAAGCDVAIACSDAIFAVNDVRQGLIPAPILPALAAKLGPRWLGRFALTGERFNAAEALRRGLVHQVCAPGQLDNAVAPIVEDILAAEPQAVIATKRLIESWGESVQYPASREDLARAAALRYHSAEAEEGRAALRENRPPAWFPPASDPTN
jgi:methylglutaconyl-CoA hydratase